MAFTHTRSFAIAFARSHKSAGIRQTPRNHGERHSLGRVLVKASADGDVRLILKSGHVERGKRSPLGAMT
jgi:hypothetical protein